MKLTPAKAVDKNTESILWASLTTMSHSSAPQAVNSPLAYVPFVTFVGAAMVGDALAQLITTTCMSRITDPISTPARYSLTNTTTTAFCVPEDVKSIDPD